MTTPACPMPFAGPSPYPAAAPGPHVTADSGPWAVPRPSSHGFAEPARWEGILAHLNLHTIDDRRLWLPPGRPAWHAPLPLTLWADGAGGARLPVGRIERLWRVEDYVLADGVLDVEIVLAQQIADSFADGRSRFPSLGVQVLLDELQTAELADEGALTGSALVYERWRVCGGIVTHRPSWSVTSIGRPGYLEHVLGRDPRSIPAEPSSLVPPGRVTATVPRFARPDGRADGGPDCSQAAPQRGPAGPGPAEPSDPAGAVSGPAERPAEAAAPAGPAELRAERVVPAAVETAVTGAVVPLRIGQLGVPARPPVDEPEWRALVAQLSGLSAETGDEEILHRSELLIVAMRMVELALEEGRRRELLSLLSPAEGAAPRVTLQSVVVAAQDLASAFPGEDADGPRSRDGVSESRSLE